MLSKTILLSTVCAIMLTPSAFSAEKKEASNSSSPKDVVDYLTKNPSEFDKIYTAYQDFLVKQEEAKKNEQMKILLNKLALSPNKFVYANPEGKTNFILFLDYECGYCRLIQKTIDKIIENDKDLKVTIVLVPIIGKDSKDVAKYAIASANQNKFIELHKKLMDKRGSISPSDVVEIAKELKIKIDKLEKDKENKDTESIINRNLDLAKEFNVSGLPTFIIGNKTFSGALPEEKLKKEISDYRKSLK